MTSSTFENQRHEHYRKVLNAFRKKLLNGGDFTISGFMKEHKLNANFPRALRNLSIIPENGIPVEWIYKNELHTNEVDNKIVNKVIDELRAINSNYAKSKAERDRNKTGKVTSAIVNREDISYLNISHQMTFIDTQLEKERTVKGYLRQEEVLFYKGIHKTLEKIKIFKELDI